MCIFIKAVRMAAETQNTLALLNDYVTACNFSVIKNTYSSTKFMLEECYPREQFFLTVSNFSLFNILCIKKNVVSSGKRNSDTYEHLQQWDVQLLLIKEFQNSIHCIYGLGKV